MRARKKRMRLYEFENEVRVISGLISLTDSDFLTLLVKPKILSLIKIHKRHVEHSLLQRSAAELHCELLNKLHSKK